MSETTKYQTWNDLKLFASYLNLTIQLKHIRDNRHTKLENELEEITKIMMNKTLPTKIKFYKNITDPELRKQYKERFIQISKNI